MRNLSFFTVANHSPLQRLWNLWSYAEKTLEAGAKRPPAKDLQQSWLPVGIIAKNRCFPGLKDHTKGVLEVRDEGSGLAERPSDAWRLRIIFESEPLI